LWELEREAERSARPRSMWGAALVKAALALASGDKDAEDLAVSARVLGEGMGIPDALGAYGVHVVTSRLLAAELSAVTPLIEMAIATYPNVPAWHGVAAASHAEAGDHNKARGCLRSFLDGRKGSLTNLFDKPGLCFASVAAYRLTDADAGTAIRDALGDSDELVVVGVGAALLGPVSLYRGYADAAAGDPTSARIHLADAISRCDAIGWSPWAGLARTAHAALATT
jgi:hypothetical protein